MAIFSKKSDEETQAVDTTAKSSNSAAIEKVAHVLIQPRLSEKAVHLNSINKYVFKVKLSANKVEVKKAVERFYGVKVSSVNIIRVEGKKRRYGRTAGQMSDYKKAVVTLKPDSKKPEIMKGV
jgi:large subunit ribosomal protein L23